jgi:O-antigen/teichoic acid export membrane protein
MVGILASSVATAEYVVASKLAMLLALSHNILNGVLRPRIGRFLSQEDWRSVEREYDQARSVSLITALMGAGSLAILGEWILSFFGGYGSSYPLLLILTGSILLSVSFGMCGGYLGIAGYAGYTLMIGILNLALNLVSNFLLIPEFEATGAALATFISILIGNIAVTSLVYYLDGWTIYPIGVAMFTISAIGTLGFSVGGLVDPLTTGLLLFGISGLFFFYKYDRLEPVARNLSQFVLKEVLKV